MKKLWIVVLTLLVAVPFLPRQAEAASQEECEIWLCLPDGFRQEQCNPAHKAMIKRIKRRKNPLPPFHECGDGKGSQSNVKDHYGRELYYPCKEGYTTHNGRRFGWDGGNSRPHCVQSKCYQRWLHSDNYGYNQCDNYAAIPRPKPNWVEIRLIDGNKLIGSRFYY